MSMRETEEAVIVLSLVCKSICAVILGGAFLGRRGSATSWRISRCEYEDKPRSSSSEDSPTYTMWAKHSPGRGPAKGRTLDI